ncbi:hypothetical protein [Sedimenticola sp.]|uniref:hypothetical protein n=1 Tax=Sedimenticola sp. TaxID=1940285 RepID=UPI003D0E0468
MTTEQEKETVNMRLASKGIGRTRMLVAALIGALMLNPPLMEIFSKITDIRPFGWPMIIFYINLIWLLLIVLVVYPKVWRRIRFAWRFSMRAIRKGGH